MKDNIRGKKFAIAVTKEKIYGNNKTKDGSHKFNIYPPPNYKYPQVNLTNPTRSLLGAITHLLEMRINLITVLNSCLLIRESAPDLTELSKGERGKRTYIYWRFLGA